MARTPDYVDVGAGVLASLRAVCLGLPEAYEERAWAGIRWRIRNRTFAHVLSIDGPGAPVTVMSFRAEGADLDVLHRAGHPFFRPGAGRGVVGIVLDDTTDWEEVEELIMDSYCVVAPKRLAGLVDRPEGPGQDGS